MSINMPTQQCFGTGSPELIVNRKFFERLERMPPICKLLIHSAHNSLLVDALDLHHPTKDQTKVYCSSNECVSATFSVTNWVSYLTNVINAVRGNHHLKTLEVRGHNINIGTCDCRKLTLLLQDPRNNTLNTVSIGDVIITRDNAKSFKFKVREGTDTDVGDRIASIAATLMRRNLVEVLKFSSVSITEPGWEVLAHALQNSSCRLRTICLRGGSRNTVIIDDDGAVALAVGLKKNCTLETISIRGVMSITTRGWEALAGVLQGSTCRVQELNLFGLPRFGADATIIIDNEGAIALAAELAKNRTLEKISFDRMHSSIMKAGWNSFAKALCDTSSINATYLSNHTVKRIGDERPPSLRLNTLLHLNIDGGGNKEIATKKILKYHRRLDMTPLFEWNLKMLPNTVTWFELARPKIRNSPWLRGINLDAKKLDTIYQFIRGMPETFEQIPKGTKRGKVDKKLDAIYQFVSSMLETLEPAPKGANRMH